MAAAAILKYVLCLSLISLSWASLTRPRLGLAATATERYVFFAGGFDGEARSSTIDIYDTKTSHWTTDKLSTHRGHLRSTSVGNYVIFGGGQSDDNQHVYDVLDMNTTPWTWSSVTKNPERAFQAATSAGRFALFSGGYNDEYDFASSVVDIFDSANGSWSTANLSIARFGHGATSNGTIALFGGGSANGTFLSRVDIFNAVTLQWSTSELSQGRTDIAATSVGKFALFAGGRIRGNTPSDVVDIYDYSSEKWSTAQLSAPRMIFAATNLGKYALFGGGCNYKGKMSYVVDIFDSESGQWSTTELSVARGDLAAASTGNIAFFGGGGEIDNSIVYDTVDVFTVDNLFISPAQVFVIILVPVVFVGVAVNVFYLKKKNSRSSQDKNRDLNEMAPLLRSQVESNPEESWEQIGSGGNGKVYRGKKPQQYVAIKVPKGPGHEEQLIQETKILISLRHKNIVKFLEFRREGDTIYLFMEYMKDGSLEDMIFKEKVKLEKPRIIQLALDVAQGLRYLHSLKPKIIHRDLKPDNVLLYNNKKRAKISDFGTARPLTEDTKAKTPCGTLGYTSPEILEEKGQDEKVDIYSFGVLLFAMVTNTRLPVILKEANLRNRLNQHAAHTEFNQLIIDCCQTDPQARPNADEIIEYLEKMQPNNTNQ